MTGSMNANTVAEQLGCKDKVFLGVRLNAREQGHLTLATLKGFMQGGRNAPDARHVPELGKLASLSGEQLALIKESAVEGAKRLWSRMSDPDDQLPLGHDGYLKLWALSRPILSAEFILLDEAQDTNPVVLGVLARQNAQIIYVGDRHQQIYEWRGAVNAMDLIKTPADAYLTTSFRFGDRIASAASRVLAHLGEQRPLTGNPAVKSYIGCDRCDAVLARTNASVIARVIQELDQGRRPHVVGGTSDILRMLRGVQHLKRNEPSDVPEFFGFTNWVEVVEFANSPEGEHLRTFVSLVDQHGETKLIAKLNEAARDERDADLVVSTAHKAKGREWDTVELANDFLIARKETANDEDAGAGEQMPDPAEVRLFYVALTRARIAIAIPAPLLEQFGIEAGPPYVAPVKTQLIAGGRPSETVVDSTSSQGNPVNLWWLVLLALLAFALFR